MHPDPARAAGTWSALLCSSRAAPHARPRPTPTGFSSLLARISCAQTLGTQRSRVLRLELTDDSDLYFLYSMDVLEDDFHLLKQDQRLLVEFSAFPDKIVELLNECMDTAEESGSSRCARNAPGSSTLASPHLGSPQVLCHAGVWPRRRGRTEHHRDEPLQAPDPHLAPIPPWG